MRGLDGKAVAVINLSKEQTKGHKARRVFLSDELQTAVTKFLATQPNVDDSCLLLARFLLTQLKCLISRSACLNSACLPRLS